MDNKVLIQHPKVAVKTPKKSKWVDLFFLHGTFVIYSLSSVVSKLASGYPMMSLPFIAWYGGMLVILVIYAGLWQQVLKRFPLNMAYVNKSVVVVWGMLWGVVFFKETVTPLMLLGSVIVLLGIRLAASNHD